MKHTKLLIAATAIVAIISIAINVLMVLRPEVRFAILRAADVQQAMDARSNYDSAFKLASPK